MSKEGGMIAKRRKDAKVEDAVASTKVLSVRLPSKEAERVDAAAKASGLNRNDYIRLRLKEGSAFVDVGRIDAVIDALRSLERSLEGYLERLEFLVAVSRDSAWPEGDRLALERQLQQGERLIEELFKAQRKAVQVLDCIRAKVK